jgi:PucR family transcriptional regulator, purine catabolism regulatory protein
MPPEDRNSSDRGVTLRELLSMPSLQDARVMAGEAGLNAPVRWIHILDFPDIVPWVTAQDVVLTGTYAFFEDPSELENLVPRLADKGVSGLIMGIGLFLKEIPQFVLDEADERDFPVISIPWQVRFEDVTFEAARKFVLHQRHLLDEIETASRSLLEASRSTDQQKTVDALSASLRRDVAILDSGGRVLAASEEGVATLAPEAYSTFLRRSSGDEDRFKNEVRFPLGGSEILVHPMSVATRCLGAIVVADAEGMEVAESLSLAVGSTVVSFQLLQHEEHEASQAQIVSEYLQEVFRRSDRVNPQVLVEFFGWTEIVPHAVAVLELHGLARRRSTGELKEARARELRTLVRTRLRHRLEGHEYLVSEFSDDLAIVLVCESDQRALSVLEPVRKELETIVAEEDCRITLGISSVDDDLQSLPRKYEEARRVISLTHRVNGPGHGATIEDLRLPDVLSRLLGAEGVGSLIADIDRLQRHDDEHGSAYLRTLAAFLQCFGNITDAAELLSVHQNTVRYRIEKIEEMLGRSMYDADFRFGLELGLQLKRLS